MIAIIFGGIAATPWMRAALRYGAIALTIVLFLLAIRRSGERVGRIAERLENTEKANETQRRMLEAAARRPRDRSELVGPFPGLLPLGSVDRNSSSSKTQQKVIVMGRRLGTRQ